MSGVWGGLFGWARSRMQFCSHSVDEVRVCGISPPKVAHNSLRSFLRASKNVAIPTTCVHGLKHSRGNYVRNCFGSSLSLLLLLSACPSLRTLARRPAPGPSHPHVDPITCTWATPPRCMFRGLRAYQGANVQVSG